MGTLSARDKKLLVFLAGVILAAAFLFLAIGPLWEANTKLDTQIAAAAEQQQLMQEQIRRRAAVQRAAETAAAEARSAAGEFYPVMPSQAIDKIVTELAVAGNLLVDDLQITMPAGSLWVVPFADSEFAAAADSAELTETAAEAAPAAQTAQSAQSGSAAEKPAAEEAADEEPAPAGAISRTAGIYGVGVQVTVSGELSALWNYIDRLQEARPAVRITNYTLTRAADPGQADALKLELEVYMSEQND